jgi:hypothetical protein
MRVSVENRIGRSAERIVSAMSRRAALRHLGGSGLAAGALIASDQRAAVALDGTSSALTEAAMRRAIGAINQAMATGDVNLLDAVFAPGYVNHTPRRSLQTGQLQSPDLAGLKASIIELRTFVPDGVVLIEEIIASDDRVAVRVTFRGTPSAVLGLNVGLVTIGGAIFARIAAGQVAESWDYDEAAELFGVVTAPITPTPVPTTPVPPTDERGATRSVSGFHAVSLQGIGTMIITQGETESLTIEAEEKVLKRIETVVQDGTLFIRPDRSFRAREQITYRLGAIQLDGIATAGTGNAQMEQLTTDQLQLVVDGAGSIGIAALSATTLAASASGTGEIGLAGTVDSQTVSLSGTARYLAAALASRVAVIEVQGTGQATLRVSESLDATVGGTGRVEYLGDPVVQQSVSGVGSVTKIG